MGTRTQLFSVKKTFKFQDRIRVRIKNNIMVRV